MLEEKIFLNGALVAFWVRQIFLLLNIFSPYSISVNGGSKSPSQMVVLR